MTRTGRRFVLVGHCRPDAYMLKGAVDRAVPGAAVAMVDDAASLAEHAAPGAVMLFNRVLDGSFADEGGVNLLRNVLSENPGVRAMLISGMAEAQTEAAQAGALPGFSKSELFDEATKRKLRAAAGLT